MGQTTSDQSRFTYFKLLQGYLHSILFDPWHVSMHLLSTYIHSAQNTSAHKLYRFPHQEAYIQYAAKADTL